MSKNMISALICAFLAVLILITSIITGINGRSSDGASKLKDVINGCNSLSEKKVLKSFSEYMIFDSPSFARCVTVEDYLSECGIEFDYMSDPTCKTNKCYVIGTAQNIAVDPEDDIGLLFNMSYDITLAYIGADYTDGLGQKQKAAISVYVLLNNDGKIVSIMQE